ncbi:TetR/AcrR family transcriptional regulator [Flindersiella endophytica]
MPKTPTARDRARAELTAEIKDECRRQLAAGGADALSLRAVARELDMASSAIYRYFPSRDDLLTALIIDSYDALGGTVEQAVAARRGGDHLGRWRAACRAVREWALEHPHEYALIYGSPIPGYSAPRDTVVPAARIPNALLGIVRAAWESARLDPAAAEVAMSRAMTRQVEGLAEVTDLHELPRPTLAAVVIAWTQLFGMVSFELFGHLEGVFDDKAAVFEHSINQLAHLIGLRAT